MERNTSRTHAATLALALLACACSREAPAPDAAASAARQPAPAATPVAAVENAAGTTLAQPGVHPADAGTDARAFAGT